MKVLSFGSLNIDYVYSVPHFITRGETLATHSLNTYSGGKGLNQSIALSKAGLNVFHAGAIGDEGLFLLEELKNANVNIDFIELLKDTRTGHTIIQKSDDGDNCILLYGGANQKITKKKIDETIKNFSNEDALVIQNEISELSYLVERAKAQKMIIAFNPSPMENNILSLFNYADYILLNEVEAGQFLKKDISNEKNPEEIVKQLREKLPSTKIVLTLGTQGSIYSDNNIIFRQEAVKAKAVDTTAAGDTFTGFFLAGIFTGKSPEWSMKYAANASAIAVTRHGAAPSIPSKEEVLKKL